MLKTSSVIVSTALLLALIVAGAAVDPNRWVAASQADAAKASIQERLARVRTDLFSRTDRTADAIRELKAILALDPGSAEGHLLLGIAYRSQGSAELMGEAVSELRQALALNPDFVPARYYLAHIYLDLGRAQRAREELEAALVKVPGNPQFLALLGEAERQLKNPRRAVELTREALKADESFAQARYYLGLALFDLGQRDEAVKELERVVQSGPKVADAYLALGTAYLDAGRNDAALTTLTQASEIDKSRPDIRIQLSRAYRMKGSLDRAEAQLTLAMPAATSSAGSPFSLQQQVEFDLQLELGLLRLQQGRLDAAARAFQKAVDMDPKHELAKRHLAEVQKLLRVKKNEAEWRSE
jgi:tetratricopeptide (TPR) repeat protein